MLQSLCQGAPECPGGVPGRGAGVGAPPALPGAGEGPQRGGPGPAAAQTPTGPILPYQHHFPTPGAAPGRLQVAFPPSADHAGSHFPWSLFTSGDGASHPARPRCAPAGGTRTHPSHGAGADPHIPAPWSPLNTGSSCNPIPAAGSSHYSPAGRLSFTCCTQKGPFSSGRGSGSQRKDSFSFFSVF